MRQIDENPVWPNRLSDENELEVEIKKERCFLFLAEAPKWGNKDDQERNKK